MWQACNVAHNAYTLRQGGKLYKIFVWVKKPILKKNQSCQFCKELITLHKHCAIL